VGAFYLFTKSIQMADFELPVFPEGFLDEKDYQPQQGGIEQIAANIQQAFPAAQKKKPTASSSANGSSGSASNKKKSLQDLFVKDKSKEAEIRKRLGIEEGDIAPKTSVAVSTGITQKPAATKAPASNYKITKPGVKTSMASDATAVATSEEQAPFVMPKSVGPVNIPAPERETIAAESTGLAPQVPIKKYEHPVLGPLSEDKLKEIEQQQKNVASAFSVMNFDKSLAQASGTGLTASGGAAELLNMLTPRAFKSGGLGIMGSLLSTSAAAIELFDKTAEGVGSIIGKGVFKLLGADEVNEALDYAETNIFKGAPVTKKLFELGQMSQGLSSAQMAAAEVNSGIADKNIGKDPVALLTSPTDGDFMDGMTKLGLSVVQQIPNLLAITATGSVVVPTAILEGGSNITEEYKKDQDISAADGITSVAKGIVAGFIENLYVKDIKALQAAGSAIGEVSWTGAKQQLKKVFEDKGEDGVRDLINRTYGSAIKKALTGSAGESVEEILTEVSNFTIDTIRSGKFDANKFNESLDKAANAGLIGFATGGLISGPVMMAAVEPLSFDQKRKVVEFNKIAADPSLSEDVRKTAQIQANKIIKENADKTSATYDLLIAMDPKKREQALTKMTEIRKMEADLEKIQDPELQKPIQEKLDKKKDELNQMKTMQLIKEMGKKAKAQAEKAATAMQGAEPAQAPVAPLEVDHTQDQTAEPILEGKSKEQVEEIKKFDKAIKSIDPKAKIVLVNSEEAFAKELEKFHSAEKARDLAQGSAGIFASNQDGTNLTVIVNTNLADASTYAHEAFHLAVTSLASKNPAKFVEMQKKILDVLNKSDSKKLTDFANSYDFSKLTEEGKQQRIAEEFLSELAGRLTSRDVRLQRSMLHDIANIIHDFIKAFNIKGLNDLADKYLGKYAQTEDLAKFFEGFATSMQKGKKIDVSYLGAKPVVLNETQKARLEGLTPGTEAYHEASRLNASQPTPLTFDPQLNNESIVDSDSDVTRQQITRLAPNGKPSNLDEKQYNTVRTPQFKDWFGDWENDPANASKFVDENGEPQVVYHGTNAEFDQFDLDQKRFEVHDKGIFFTPELSAAKQYGEIQMPVFLNAKTLDFSTMDRNDSFTQLRAKENELLNNTTAEGVVLTTSDKEGSNVKQFVVFDPNQAKSATGNVGTFSTESDNIRQQKANLWDGTRSARQVSESKAKERKDLKSLTLPKNIYKELFERNANIAEALKKAGMEETFYMLYNKAGATPYATRKFAEAQLEIFGKLSKAEKNQLNDIAQLRRVIAVDTNFENRIAEQKKNGLKEGEKALEMPKHPKFNEYGTGAEIDNNKSVAQEQLDKLKQHLGDEAFNKINDRVTKLFGAFSDILKYKYENGLINKETYDLYKDYEYIPRQFLFDIDLEDIPASAFNTRGVSITKDELAKIGRGSDEFAEVDTEKMLKMAMIAAQHRVFTNRAIQNMAKELESLNASGSFVPWLKPANITQLKKGVDALEKDGSPKIEGADDGFRNMFYKKDGKRYAVQLKESYAKEFYDEELYDTNNVWYKLATNALGAKITQTMAVGANPFFVLRNIPVDILSQVYYNNIYSGHGLGVTAQMAKGFAGTFEIMAKMAKASSKIGDNSEILNLIKEYGEAGGLMTTQTDDSTYLGKVGDVLGYLGNISEVAAKLAAYKNVKGDLIKKFKKDNGTDPNDEQLKKIQLEAAYKARSAMDFNRGGLATKFGNGFLPFFNIQFQVAKISAGYVKNNPVKFFNKISQSMGLVVGLTLLNMAKAGSDWENKDLKRDKETKLLFMNPFGKNADGTLSYMALQVPAPVKFFWNIAQRIAETIHYQMNGLTPPSPEEGMRDKMLAEFKKYAPNLKSSLMPPAFKAISEYLDNEDYFYGRKLSQDHLKNIFFSQEGAENENILTFYKVLFQGLEKNTGWGFSPERVQKASESVITSPEYNALVSAMYAATEWMTDKAYKGMYGQEINPKLKSKYLTGDYSNAMSAFFKSGVGTMFKKTDAKKNQTLKDYEKDAELKERIDYENKRINTEKIEITRYVKRLINKEKENGITLNDRRPQLSNYINRFKEDELKKYASHYIEIQLNRNKVAYKKNIPTYLTIIYEATSPEAQAIALKKAFGNSIYSNPMLKKDLKLMGFGNSVYKEAQTEEVKFAPKND
jgi:hypothetical protein